eukprot:657364-Rhodomonas_salina.1
MCIRDSIYYILYAHITWAHRGLVTCRTISKSSSAPNRTLIPAPAPPRYPHFCAGPEVSATAVADTAPLVSPTVCATPSIGTGDTRRCLVVA